MAINSFEYEKGSGFEEDRFNRKGFAEKLASKLTKEGPASVFALDAPWGSGKTIFLQQFADLLKCGAEKKEQWNVIYYDAFKEDFAEDALLPLVSAILEGLAEEQSTTSQIEKVGKSALPIAKRLLGSGIRGALKWASAGLLDGKKISDVATEAITEELDSAGDLIYENLVGNDTKRQEQEIFVSALNDAFEAFEGSQTLIIIDELDRCRPEFAIQTLERVKHIFGKVNCTFLFGVNRQELAAIVQGYYGPEFSGGKYLQRFFDFELTFPARRGDSIALQHLSSLAQKPQDHRGITRYVQRMLEVNFLRFKPTLRDIEKIVQFGRYRELQTAYGVPELMLASCLIVTCSPLSPLI